MNNKAERTKVFLRTLKFQNFISPVLLAVAVLVLTAVLSAQAGSSVASVEAAASALVCPNEIISYWTLDEDTGTTFFDSILDNDATCPGGGNCPTSVPGLVNLARTFDGDDRLTVPHDASLDWTGNPSFSIELWVRVPSQTCGSSPGGVFIGKHASSGARWWLSCAQSSGNPDRATFFLRDSAGTNVTLFGSPSFDDDNWHHLVAVRDATANETRLYVDSAQAASSNQSFNGNFANTSDLTIGYDNATTPASHANTTIDEIALYNRALTPAEILDHYNGGAGKAYCTETVAPQIEPIDDQTATVGLPFTYDVEAAGDPAPTFALADGSPEGMTINAITGEINWTPDATGIFDVTVEATNVAGSDNETFTITVNSIPAITAIANQTATASVPFSYDVEAEGVPAPSFSLAPGSPAGMTINDTTGIISWTPADPGDFEVTVVATNVAGSDSATFTITVNSIPVITAIPDATLLAGETFTYDVEAEGVPAPTFALAEGSPAGMTIDATTGEISWTPAAGGVFEITVVATNVAGSDSATFTITVNAPPVIDPIPNQGAVVGQPFTYTVQASGHPAPTFALVGDSPLDMTIDATTGLIEWTPDANGIFPVTVVATNIVSDDEASFTIEVTDAPVITTISNQTAVVGVPFTYDVEASGDPAPTFALAPGSPAGMTIDATTGVISWTPTAAGTFDVTVIATNDAGSDTEDFTITVSAPPVITPILNQTAVVGQLFTYDVEATGDPAPTFSLVVSPAGMTINATTGLISWTPTAAGNVNVRVQAQNPAGTATANFTIAVAEPGVEVDHLLYLPIIIGNP